MRSQLSYDFRFDYLQVAMKRYEQAMIAFEGAEPGTIHVTVELPWKPPGTA